MLPSSVLCREQEAVQRRLADTAPLPNVRLVAERAAAAWAHEAMAADRREARQARVRDIAASAASQKKSTAGLIDRDLSENPDLGSVAEKSIGANEGRDLEHTSG